jgi:hypothetical protein
VNQDKKLFPIYLFPNVPIYDHESTVLTCRLQAILDNLVLEFFFIEKPFDNLKIINNYCNQFL